jgi:hypothetical protein
MLNSKHLVSKETLQTDAGFVVAFVDFMFLKVMNCLKPYANARAECLYFKCTRKKELNSCRECPEFPCKKHYGQTAVYAKMPLDSKNNE